MEDLDISQQHSTCPSNVAQGRKPNIPVPCKRRGQENKDEIPHAGTSENLHPYLL